MYSWWQKLVQEGQLKLKPTQFTFRNLPLVEEVTMQEDANGVVADISKKILSKQVAEHVLLQDCLCSI